MKINNNNNNKSKLTSIQNLMILLLFVIKLLFNIFCVEEKEEKKCKDEQVAGAKITRHHTIYVKLQNFQNIFIASKCILRANIIGAVLLAAYINC